MTIALIAVFSLYLNIYLLKCILGTWGDMTPLVNIPVA